MVALPLCLPFEQGRRGLHNSNFVKAAENHFPWLFPTRIATSGDVGLFGVSHTHTPRPTMELPITSQQDDEGWEVLDFCGAEEGYSSTLGSTPSAFFTAVEKAQHLCDLRVDAFERVTGRKPRLSREYGDRRLFTDGVESVEERRGADETKVRAAATPPHTATTTTTTTTSAAAAAAAVAPASTPGPPGTATWQTLRGIDGATLACLEDVEARGVVHRPTSRRLFVSYDCPVEGRGDCLFLAVARILNKEAERRRARGRRHRQRRRGAVGLLGVMGAAATAAEEKAAAVAGNITSNDVRNAVLESWWETKGKAGGASLDSTIRNLYCPDLGMGWGIHQIQTQRCVWAVGGRGGGERRRREETGERW